MPARPSRLERITNLSVVLLETPRPLSLREIGAAVAGYPAEPGALRQAFERDKRTLRDGGIPITVERLDGQDQVGYRILPEEYYLPDLGLSPEEQEALSFVLAAVRLEGSAAADLSVKLGIGPRAELPPLAVLPSLPALGDLQEALRLRAPVRFSYRGRERVIEGYGLMFREGSWYLLGRDTSAEDGNELRTFRVDRIAGEVAREAGRYELPEGLEIGREIKLATFVANEADQARTVELDVDVREATSVASYLGVPAASRSGDGTVHFVVEVADEQAFISFVLGLGDAAVLTSPAELREQVIEALGVVAGSR